MIKKIRGGNDSHLKIILKMVPGGEVHELKNSLCPEKLAWKILRGINGMGRREGSYKGIWANDYAKLSHVGKLRAHSDKLLWDAWTGRPIMTM